MTTTTGLCRHCGRQDAPVNEDGFIDRHRRADYRRGIDRANELCYSSLGGNNLRPGQPCTHRLAITRKTCLSDMTAPRKSHP